MSKRFAEAFHLVEEGLAILYEHDPHSDRSSEVSQNVYEAMQYYTEILKEKKMKVFQTAVLSFFQEKGKH
jgi:hypothetical protein